MSRLLWIVVTLAILSLAEATRENSKKSSFTEDINGDKVVLLDENESEKREGKLFSLFNVVQFKNSGCRSLSSLSSSGTGSTARNGTCFTSSECSSKGGTASGNCAAGFGVCCVFLVSTSGSTISQNCTYIRNPGFPTAYTSTSAVSYTIKKCSNNVCSLRLDFESFTIQGTGAMSEINGGVCLDTFNVAVNTKQNIPTICGQNTGQHMYIDLGNQASDTATLSFAFQSTATSASRSWEIKVTQIPCCGGNSANIMPPPGCLQWNTGLTGRLSTFNFIPTNDNQLQLQDYNVCIRQEEGYCCIQYTPCSDANSFSLDKSTTTSMTDSLCTLDFISIPGSSATCIQGATNFPVVNKYCGDNFNAMNGVSIDYVACDCSQPFTVSIFTDSLNDLGAAIANAAAMTPSRGVCLTYTQIPCSS